jgi:hypothetical protein
MTDGNTRAIIAQWLDEREERVTVELEQAEARIEEMEEALRSMVGLFSADDMLLKGTHLHAALKQARAALEGTND